MTVKYKRDLIQWKYAKVRHYSQDGDIFYVFYTIWDIQTLVIQILKKVVKSIYLLNRYLINPIILKCENKIIMFASTTQPLYTRMNLPTTITIALSLLMCMIHRRINIWVSIILKLIWFILDFIIIARFHEYLWFFRYADKNELIDTQRFSSKINFTRCC